MTSYKLTMNVLSPLSRFIPLHNLVLRAVLSVSRYKKILSYSSRPFFWAFILNVLPLFHLRLSNPKPGKIRLTKCSLCRSEINKMQWPNFIFPHLGFVQCNSPPFPFRVIGHERARTFGFNTDFIHLSLYSVSANTFLIKLY